MRNIFFVAEWFIIGSTRYSQTFDKAGLDRCLQIRDSNHKFMGGLALTQNGKVIYHKSIGHADVEKKAELNNDTKFLIGSIYCAPFTFICSV
ncbi:MAG: serine hydrolase [Ginsengibacter sp.]